VGKKPSRGPEVDLYSLLSLTPHSGKIKVPRRREERSGATRTCVITKESNKSYTEKISLSESSSNLGKDLKPVSDYVTYMPFRSWCEGKGPYKHSTEIRQRTYIRVKIERNHWKWKPIGWICLKCNDHYLAVRLTDTVYTPKETLRATADRMKSEYGSILSRSTEDRAISLEKP